MVRIDPFVVSERINSKSALRQAQGERIIRST